MRFTPYPGVINNEMSMKNKVQTIKPKSAFLPSLRLTDEVGHCHCTAFCLLFKHILMTEPSVSLFQISNLFLFLGHTLPGSWCSVDTPIKGRQGDQAQYLGLNPGKYPPTLWPKFQYTIMTSYSLLI